MAQAKPAHSKIGASSYYRWKACPGSVRLSKGIVAPESEYARQGTIAHELAAQMLMAYFHNDWKPKVSAGYPSDDLEAVKTYVEIIKREAIRNGCQVDKKHVLLEHRFNLSSVHPDLFGTADAVLYGLNDKMLHVFDYKHGSGIPVEVKDNIQLLYYGLGAMLDTGFAVDTLVLHIVQPRCDHADGPHRKWSLSSFEMLEFMADLEVDALATEDPNAPLSPGAHCRFCPAAASRCDAIHNRALTLAKTEFNDTTPYEGEALTKALDFLPTLEGWIKRVREFAYGESMHGRTPPRYKLVEKRAVRKWDGEHIDVAFDLAGLGLKQDQIWDMKIKSPTQVEKVLPKADKKKIEPWVTKKSSGHKLVHESEKGVPVKLDPASEFTQITGE